MLKAYFENFKQEKILEEEIHNAKTVMTFIPYSTLNLQLYCVFFVLCSLK